MLRRLSFELRFAQGFLRACFFKSMKSMARVTLPCISFVPVENKLDELINDVMAKVAMRIDTLACFTSRKCFFRAYTAAYILRKNRIDATLNIGMHHLHKRDRAIRGHCWLTLHGRPLSEKSDPKVRYEHFLGTGQNGVCYWLGGEKTDNIKMAHCRTAAQGIHTHVDQRS